MAMDRAAVSWPLFYDVVTWIGICGSALALFTRLGSLIVFSRWAQAISDAWASGAQRAAKALDDWFGLVTGMAPEHAILLSFVASALTAILGVRFKTAATSAHRGGQLETSLRLPSAWFLPVVLLAAAALGIASLWVASRSILMLAPLHPWLGTNGVLLLALIGIGVAASVPFALMSRDRIAALGFVGLFAPVPVALTQIPLLFADGQTAAMTDRAAFISGIGMSVAAMLVPLALYLAPAPALNRRFVFVLGGTATLLAINYLTRNYVG